MQMKRVLISNFSWSAFFHMIFSIVPGVESFWAACFELKLKNQLRENFNLL